MSEELKLNEPVKSPVKQKKRIMVAGIGNMFLQDDGFGVEVLKRLRENDAFRNVELNDAGTGGLKLAYDLMKGYDGLILIDASTRGEAPGTLYIIEPDEKEIEADLEEGSFIDPHGADPATVLRFIKALKAWPGKVVIIGCEPGEINDFQIGLSADVNQAVDKAVQLAIETIDAMNNH